MNENALSQLASAPGSVVAMVKSALEEDAPWGDITSETFIPIENTTTAYVVAREPGIMCGEWIFDAVRTVLQDDVIADLHVRDSESFKSGERIATLTGPTRHILLIERVLLNYLQRLCAVSTQTRQYVAAISHTGARIVDTRKTTPNMRLLERYAVRCGGGLNHRYCLSDAVMLKDNHLAVMRGLTISLEEQILKARAQLPHTTKIEIEIDNLDQLDEVLSAQPDVILLDNFSLADMRHAVERIGKAAVIEASGGITLDNVVQVAGTGVNVISIGALTHSVQSLDVGMDFPTSNYARSRAPQTEQQ